MPPTPTILDFTPQTLADNLDALVAVTLETDREVAAALVTCRAALRAISPNTQGFFGPLGAYLGSPDSGDPAGEERRPLGRVRAVVVYPEGHYEPSSDASRLLIVLTLKEGDDGDDLRTDLGDIVGCRCWP